MDIVRSLLVIISNWCHSICDVSPLPRLYPTPHPHLNSWELCWDDDPKSSCILLGKGHQLSLAFAISGRICSNEHHGTHWCIFCCPVPSSPKYWANPGFLHLTGAEGAFKEHSGHHLYVCRGRPFRNSIGGYLGWNLPIFCYWPKPPRTVILQSAVLSWSHHTVWQEGKAVLPCYLVYHKADLSAEHIQPWEYIANTYSMEARTKPFETAYKQRKERAFLITGTNKDLAN